MDFIVTEITQDNFKKEVMESKTLVLVDFYADWCGPCKSMDSSLEELYQQYSDKIVIYKANLENNSQLANEYRVMALPTLLFFQHGELIKKHVGLISKKDLAIDIERLAGA